jgi:hypothetical protein
VLEKCGFVRSGEERTPASERSDAIDELVFTLAR